MGNDFKCDHFELLVNVYQDVKNFIVPIRPELVFEMGKGPFGGDMCHHASTMF